METARPLATALSVNRRWRNADESVTMNLMFPLEEARLAAEEAGMSQRPVDPELSIMRWRALGDGHLIAAFLNWGCHPVTGGRAADGKLDFYRVSADCKSARDTFSIWPRSLAVTNPQSATRDCRPTLRQGDGVRCLALSVPLLPRRRR